MINVLFVCYGNICRSPMAEFLFKDMLKKKNINNVYVESAGTSDEELGNPVYYETKKILNSLNIDCNYKKARKIKTEDYVKFDYIITMENSNRIDCLRFFCKDDKYKIKNLLDFTDNPHDIADPWYTRNFQKTYQEIMIGLNGLLKDIIKELAKKS